MKIITSWISIVLVICLLGICVAVLIHERSGDIEDEILTNGSDNKVEISEFEFSLTFGPRGRTSINTFTNTITKDLALDGVITTKYVISKNDRKKIREMLSEMDILAFPKNLNVRSYYDHTEIISFHAIIDGREHTVSWTVPWDFDFYEEDRLTVIHHDFMEFVKFIRDLVIGSKEYKALPEARGGYL
ncbi:MAG TPA: hypothetical protein P5315_09770 [Clostridia bacterium]|nr:hypothetical protein [Clostridia bacterium]